MTLNSIKKHFYSVDFLKVFATILVIRLHTGISSQYPAYTYYLAGCAVPIFFMVNGALILNRPTVSWNYALAKIGKILRLTLLWSILFTFMIFILKHKWSNPILFLINSFLQRGGIGNFWFLGALMLIYLLLPKLHKTFNHNKFKALSLILFLGLICVFIEVLSIYFFLQGRDTIAKMIPQVFRIWTWLFYFCLGGIIFKYLPIIKNKITFQIRLIFLMIMSFVAGPLQYLLVNQWYKYYSPEYAFDNPVIILWNISIFIFFTLLNENKLVLKTARLSQLTFGIYIIHGILIIVINFFGYFNYSLWYFNVPFLTMMSALITLIVLKLPLIKWFVKL